MERGTQIGRFVVVTELGRGGMGAVYVAHDPQLDRQVALKILRDANGEEEDRVRMLREGQAMARVTHPNVITVYEVGTEGGVVFLAQELLDGGTLENWLEAPRSQRAIVERFIAAGRGLAAAHAVGLVHRDFKPENVLLGKDGRIRVADFGLARAAGESLAITTRGRSPASEDTRNPMSQLTATGTVLGTPLFMAPEQHRGERADARSDQFAFCVALYHALHGAWPYEGKTMVALADAVLDGRLSPPPASAKVPAGLRKIVLRGLATDPSQRYPSMTELLDDLAKHVVSEPKRRSPWLYVGAGLIGSAAAAGAIALITNRGSVEPATPDATLQPTPPPIGSGDAVRTEKKGASWITAAIDRGQFGDALEKSDLAMKLALTKNAPAEAAIAAATSAYLHVQQGDLESADAMIAKAKQHAGTDETALAFIGLARSASLLARGEFVEAKAFGKRCGEELGKTDPVIASLCFQLAADAATEEGSASRAPYERALALIENLDVVERKTNLRLALAQLDLEQGEVSRAAAAATAVKTECEERNAVGCAVLARILIARTQKANAEAHEARATLAAVKPATIEALPVRIAHEIALGEVEGYLKESDDGVDHIEAARTQAAARGLTLLVFEARLARLRVLDANGDPESKTFAAELITSAKAAKLGRFVKLAEAVMAESEPSRATLPADDGVPAVRPESP